MCYAGPTPPAPPPPEDIWKSRYETPWRRRSDYQEPPPLPWSTRHPHWNALIISVLALAVLTIVAYLTR